MDRGFHVQFQGHRIAGDRLGAGLDRQVLILHGAGGAHRDKFRLLREELAEYGLGTCAFDFIGHGETGGELKTSSLKERVSQACAVIDHLGLYRSGPMAVIGASMGAHTAVHLLERYPIDALVLLVPAMYATAAYGVRFDQGFSEIIRRPFSWRDSDGWEILGRFSGRLLVVAAEHDAVIPKEVIERFYRSAERATHREIAVAPGVSHMIFTELRERNPREMARMVDKMAGVLCSL